MMRGAALTAVLLLCGTAALAETRPAAASSLGSMRLPVTAADLAQAVGVDRPDAATILLDIVRFVFASPDGASGEEAIARAALTHALDGRGSGDFVPLPMSARAWREHVLGSSVPDERLAAEIFRRRSYALLYHALLGVDPETLAWLETQPAVIRVLLNHSAAAAYARSLRVRAGAVQTPGEDAREVWTRLVDADPADPAAFITKLFSTRSGRLAGFYDAIAHTDVAHQAFAIGRKGDAGRVDRAAQVLQAVLNQPLAWHPDDRPFLRPDVDLSVVLRVVAVDARGVPREPASRRLWAGVFGAGDSREDKVDAEWLARVLLDESQTIARRRLDTFAFAQRAFRVGGEDRDLAFVLRQYPNHATLLSLLSDNGFTGSAECAAAIRVASSLEDDDVMTVFQSSLAVLDRARRATTLSRDSARTAIASLVRAAGSRHVRASLLTWASSDLVRTLAPTGAPLQSMERLLVEAMAGRTPASPPVVRWEGKEYVVDVAAAELRRLLGVRALQHELPVERALSASNQRDLLPLAHSLAGLVYAAAAGDGQAPDGGKVWQRHRFGGSGAAQNRNGMAWQVATEMFGASGWHVNGSLLYLDVALAHLSLRRLDESEMPVSSHLSTKDRATIQMGVVLADSRRVTDDERDAISAAISRGRERVASLQKSPDSLEATTQAVGEWRRNAIGWSIANHSETVAGAFTILELFRIGGGEATDAWGAASFQVDGCICLRMPQAVAWEDAAGRPSTGQLGAQFADVMLRTAEALAARKLPALLLRDVAAFATCDALDRARTAWSDDWLALAFAARDISEDRFDDYIAALAATGPLFPASKGSRQ